MQVTLPGLVAVSVLAVVLTLVLRTFSRERATFHISLLSVSFLAYFLSGDPITFLTVYVSSITALVLYSRFFYIPFTLLTVLALLQLYQGMLPSLALSVSLGTLVSILLSDRMKEFSYQNEAGKGDGNTVEIRRDLFQAGSGIFTIAIFLTVGLRWGESTIFLIMLLLYFLGNYSYLNRTARISSFFSSMERSNVNLGFGSLVLATGVLLVFGLVPSPGVVLISIFLVLIADPAATIAGKLLKGPSLPYNRRKTVSGLTVALSISVLFSFLAGGIFMTVYGITGALVESATQKPLDDNLTVPVSSVILYYILSYF